MSILTRKIKHILEEKNISIYQLSKMINYHEGALNAMINNKKAIPNNVENNLLPILKISREEFEGWILVDKYSKEVLMLAIQAKKNFPYRRKSILTAKIDEILEKKGLSRTVLAKQINYNQSGLNKMIISKISMSKSVIEKLAAFFEISQNEIIAWILADKYSLKTLEYAISQ